MSKFIPLSKENSRSEIDITWHTRARDIQYKAPQIIQLVYILLLGMSLCTKYPDRFNKTPTSSFSLNYPSQQVWMCEW